MTILSMILYKFDPKPICNVTDLHYVQPFYDNMIYGFAYGIKVILGITDCSHDLHKDK